MSRVVCPECPHPQRRHGAFGCCVAECRCNVQKPSPVRLLRERAEKAEAERESLRVEVERLRGLLAGKGALVPDPERMRLAAPDEDCFRKRPCAFCSGWWRHEGGTRPAIEHSDPACSAFTEASARDFVKMATGREAPAAAQSQVADLRVRLEGVERAGRRFIAAQDARIEAGRQRARVEAETSRKWPRLPKRIPRNAVNLADLSAEEQAAHAKRCAEDMAPITAAGKADADARAEEAVALAALRAALKGEDRSS